MPDDPPPVLSGRGAALVLAAGGLLTLAFVWTARPPEAGAGWRVAFVGLHVVGSAGLWLLLRAARPTVRQVAVGAVLFRVLALPMLPSLSDDGYRYLWDGRVTVETDVSPYALRPSDPRLAALDDGVLLARMNSPDYFSVYPPASQAVFAAAAAVHAPLGWRASWWLLKALLVVAEGVGIACLLRLVGARGAALYAWSPLAVVEIAGQGHTEALVIAGLGLALVGGRGAVASAGATVAGLVKLWPLALLPLTWRRDGRRGIAASVGIGLGLTAVVWTPGAPGHVGESLALFFGTFDEYAAPYRALKAALFPMVGEAAGQVASLALSAGLLLALGLAWLGDDGTPRTLRLGAVVLVLGVALTSSTLHPWYWLPVLWVVPLLQSSPSWTWIASTSTLGYLAYVLPGTELPVLIAGWGGGLLLALGPRRDRS